MKRLFTTYILIAVNLIPIKLCGQSSQVDKIHNTLDSLKRSIREGPETEKTVEAAKGITQLYFTGIYHLDSAKKYASVLFEVSERIDSDRGKALAQYYLGRVADGKGEYASAINLTKRYLESELVRSDTSLLANGLYSLANIYIHQGNLEEAMNHQLQVLRLDEASGNLRNIGLSLNNMGIIMKELNRDDDAIRYLERARSIFEELGDSSNVAMALSNLGGLYSGKGDQDKALETFQQSLEIYKQINHDRGIALGYLHIGNIERVFGKYQSSHRHIQESITILKQIDLRKELAESYQEMALIYKSLQKKDSAIFYNLRSLELAAEVGDKKAVRRAYGELSDLEANNANYKDAYNYFRLYHAISDSILNESIADRISRLEIDYEVERQEAEIKNLRTQQKLNERLSKTLRWALIVTGISALLVVGFLIYRMITNKKLLQLEQIQNRKVEQAYAELKNTQTQLVQSEKMASIGQLTAGIAHEINNPVNYINAGIESLKTNVREIDHILDLYRSLSRENFKEKLNIIHSEEEKIDIVETRNEIQDLIKSVSNGAERTTEIVKGLRTFSRLDENEIKPADIHEGIDLTLVMLHNKYKNHIEIEKHYGKLPMLECFPGKLNQVFMNILSNAIDAIVDKGKITIKTWEDKPGDKASISIKDNGTGMTEQTLSNIFNPFFSTKEVGKGTGLGLSISHGIIEQHKGSIKVLSEPDKGAEFIIALPIKHD